MKNYLLRDYALPIAESIQLCLLPYCYRIEIAGSLRRKTATVGDIEIVCVVNWQHTSPRTDKLSLFETSESLEPTFLQELKRIGTLKTKADRKSKYIRIYSEYSGLNIDIFVVEAADFGRQFAIRTGPAEYSRDLAIAWRKKGWVGIDGTLYPLPCCQQDAKGNWSLRPKAILISTTPPFYEEKDFYEWLGIPFLEPENRGR